MITAIRAQSDIIINLLSKMLIDGNREAQNKSAFAVRPVIIVKSNSHPGNDRLCRNAS